MLLDHIVRLTGALKSLTSQASPRGRSLATAALLLTSVGWMTGCASTSETAEKDQLTANVGNYPPGPSGATKPRVGVPPFKVQAAGSFGGGSDLNDLAADQMTTLLYKTGRFSVVERAQLEQLLKEQNLEGIVTPGELAKPGKVRGVDYLLIGKVTNLRVKQENKSRGFGLAQIGGAIGLGGADVKKKDTIITTECGVDIRLVDPTTGEVKVAESSEYKRSDSASATGVTLLGATSEADASISMSEDDKGKILRLALDDAVRKSLNDIDAFLVKQPHASSGQDVTPPMTNGTAPANSTSVTPPATGDSAVAAKKFCPNCGHEVAPGAKFCPSCGKAI